MSPAKLPMDQSSAPFIALITPKHSIRHNKNFGKIQFLSLLLNLNDCTQFYFFRGKAGGSIHKKQQNLMYTEYLFLNFFQRLMNTRVQ